MATRLDVWLQNIVRQTLPYHKDTKICVVSIIGKSRNSYGWCKAGIINNIVGAEAFSGEFLNNEEETKDDRCYIEAYFDIKNSTVFLHLVSAYDPVILSRHISSISEGDHVLNFYEFWEPYELAIARHVLFLFSISHMMLVVQPNSTFDISYVRFLRNLDSLRVKVQATLSERLKKLSANISRGWIANARLCAPRLLFTFHKPPVRAGPDKRMNPIRKLEDAIEDQIYAILRKSRVVTNNCANSICTLPSNDPFVYIFSSEEDEPDAIAWLLDYMRNFPEDSAYSSEHDDSADESDSGFHDFLMQHIDLAHTKGFDDNIGRNAVQAFFELPKLKAFVKVATDFYEFFIKDEQNSMLTKMTDLFKVELNFSESRCSKVLPMAISSYQDGLPPYYTMFQHKARLAQALQVLSVQARGPALDRTSRKMVEECEKYWLNGRQACEVLSLMGNNCVNKLHSTEDEPSSTLPIMSHTSKLKYVSTCNCGHRQAARDDPFDLKTANYSFYMDTEEFSCCRHLDRIEFPIFKPSTAEVKAASMMLEKLKISALSQDEDGSRGDTGSNDYLPDTDNKHLLRPVVPEQGGEEVVSADLARELAHDSQLSPADVVMTPPPDDELKTEADTQPESEALGEGSKSRSTDPEEKIRDTWNDAEVDDDTGVDGDIGAGGGDGDEEISPDDDDDDDVLPSGDVKTQEDEPKQSSVASQSLESDLMTSSDIRDEEELTDEKADTGSPAIVSSKGGDAKDGALALIRGQALETREASTVEYLPGMLHLSSPPGLLPRFPSWSLVCLGSSSLYSHAHGLREHPNFSHGSSYLLSWDANLRVELERWHQQMEILLSTRRPMGPPRPPKKSRSRKGEEGTVSVKVFIGFEYECPRGHRFMLQSPNKMLKHSGPGGPKDSGSVLVRNDMPLWFPCSCRTSKPPVPGQLTRLHIVTPKAPVNVTINPRIQPAPPSCPTFYPGNSAPIRLRSSEYWILRFPFVYMGDHGPYFPPKDGAIPSGRFMKNLIGVQSTL